MTFTGVAISGRAGAGKSTLARAILEQRPDLRAGSFAAALKRDLQKIGIVKGDPAFREIAQIYGTEHCRVKYGPDYWVERLRGGTHTLAGLAGLVVDDMRFPNEHAACGADGLLLVRVHADEDVRSKRLGGPCPEHPSEWALDSYPFALHVCTDDGRPVEELAASIVHILGRAAAA